MVDLKKWIGGAVLLLALILVFGFYINRKAEQIVANKQSLIDQNLALEFLSSLKLESGEAEKHLSNLEKILPSQEPREGFDKSLEALAKKRNLTAVVNFGESVAGNESQPSFINFQATVGGPYINIIGFLRDIRSGQFLVKFTSINLEQKNKSFEANINGQVFFQ